MPRARAAPDDQAPKDRGGALKKGGGIDAYIRSSTTCMRAYESWRASGLRVHEGSPLLTRAAGSAIGRGPIANAVHGGTRCSVYFGFRSSRKCCRQPARQACQRDSQPATSVPWARSFQRRRSTGCPSTASSRTCATTRSGVSSACKHLPRPARQGGPAALALGDNGRRLRSHRACTRPGAQPYFVQALGPLTCACLGRDL